jgi:hypothetical protein
MLSLIASMIVIACHSLAQCGRLKRIRPPGTACCHKSHRRLAVQGNMARIATATRIDRRTDHSVRGENQS